MQAVAATGALVIGVLGAALVSDNAAADGDDRVQSTATARPVPVLAAGPPGSTLSSAVSQYAIGAFSDPTRGLVLADWGAVLGQLLDDEPLPAPPDGEEAVDDPRLSDPDGTPSFTDPCATADPPAGCPDGDTVPAEVLGDEPLTANAVVLHAFPQPDAALAAECRFADVGDDELPLAVITANPGDIELRIGDALVEVESDDDEIAEWEAWQAAAEGPRPPETFVAHCVAVPRPAGTAPVHVVAVAVDGAGQVAVAETVVAATALDGLPPATVTPVDGTLVRVEVPLPEGGADAAVEAVPLAAFGAATPDCATLPGAPLPADGAWRSGSSELTGSPPAPGERPYLADAPRLRRVTLPLPEGEPSLLCIVTDDGAGSSTTSAVAATPPDARRLTLGVSEVDTDESIGAGDVVVRGTFAELGWTPCGIPLPAGEGTRTLGPEGRLCTSGGDTGAIAAAGGVLDVVVEVGPARHVVRILLSATPGGTATETYRLPIPAPDFEGVLCTAGVDQPGCVEPEGDAVLGALELTAAWDEGPIGPAVWRVTAVPAAPLVETGT